jgi:hypothetical protein
MMQCQTICLILSERGRVSGDLTKCQSPWGTLFPSASRETYRIQRSGLR